MHTLAADVIRNTQMSLYLVTKSLEAIPADKFDWCVSEKARTPRAILHEMIVFPQWIQNCLAAGGMGEFPSMEGLPEDQAGLIAELQRVTAAHCDAIAATSEADWAKPNPMPWSPDATAGQIWGYHEWNNTYHLGQLNFIQLCYGDEEFHM